MAEAGDIRATVAIACSGLGYVRRGNETWARDVAAALHRAGVPVTLFGGGPNAEAASPYIQVPNLRRDFPVLRRWLPWPKRYLAEQLTFLVGLRRRLRKGGWRMVHLCDPDLALQMHWRTARSQLRVAFKDGMRLGPQWCSRLDFVQVLAPYYRDVVARDAGVNTSGWHVIPHLVDTNQFRPAENRQALRAGWKELGLNGDDFVVLGVGDYSEGGNKRLDWLVREVAGLPKAVSARLVLAGHSEPEVFDRFGAWARQQLGSRVTLLRNLARDDVRRLYRLSDVYAHAALHEPFGIVFLEAMACGLPLVGHTWEVTRWIVGDAGVTLDMTEEGALRSLIARWETNPREREAFAAQARMRAVEHFSPDRLVPLYEKLYEAMRSDGLPSGKGGRS